MSNVRVKNLQLGISSDATKTFVLRVPAVENGTIEVCRGNLASPGSPIVKINADGGVFINNPMFSVYQTTNQSLTSGLNRVALDTKELDTHNFFNTSTYRYTPLIAGWYQFNGVISTGNTVLAALWKNGVENKRGTQGAATAHAINAMIYMNGTTDYAELFVHCGGATTVSANLVNVATWFQGFLVRAA